MKGGGDDRSGVAEWLGRWTCNLVVLGSSPPPSYSPDLFSVFPCLTPRMRCLNSLMVCLLPILGISNTFCLFGMFVSLSMKWIYARYRYQSCYYFERTLIAY